jgi:hypothetical protein
MYMYQFSQLPMIVIVMKYTMSLFFSQFVKRYYKNGCFTGKYPIRRGSCRFQFVSGKVETYIRKRV